ncbi:MAG: metallophosphoesterase, partial [Minisyncoccia bacterium]
MPLSKVRIAIFLAIALALLFIVNLTIYETSAAIFALHSAIYLLVLGSFVGGLSVSFILSTLLGMRYYNWFTRIYYTISAVWIGFVVYLFLVSIIFGLLLILHMPSLTLAGKWLLAAALITGLYGVLHARRIHIKQVNIALLNLPSWWRGKKVIFASDLHLGQLHGVSWARYVVEKINSLPHEAVFIGGDLFDGTGAFDVDELIVPFKNLTATKGAFFITGNHEEFGNNSKFIAAIHGCGIRILMNEIVTIEGLQIVGVDYAEASEKENFR